jgi:CO dehydrogenase/acetyl-CoA synthase delta subunit
MAEERSVSDVLQDILRNLQEMVRSEIRLAKLEIRGEVKTAVSSGTWIAAGAVAAMCALSFMLWTVVYALATRMPLWTATLLIAVVMAATGATLIMSGIRRGTQTHPIPVRTVASVKENLEWMKQPTK